MTSTSVAPVDEPRDFLSHELFFSLTDEKGKILCGNSVFTRISGYAESELIDKPHNIIRHPDMPRCVFKLLWDYLLSGRTIAAYVKNMAADGRYYWVLATAMPCRDGFLSVRLKPTTGLFDAARSLYREVLAFERKIEAQSGKKEAIAQATSLLLEKLSAAGFADYDAFMRAALAEELAALSQQSSAPTTHAPPGCPESLLALKDNSELVAQELGSIFSSLDLFQRLSDQLVDRRESLGELGPALSFLALNANLSASRLGADGATLSVISRELRDRSKEADRVLKALMEQMGSLNDSARQLAFDVAVAQIEAQVCEAFSHEVISAEEGGGHCVDQGLEPLNEELRGRSHAVLGALSELASEVKLLQDAATRLVDEVSRMKLVQLNGKIETAGIRNAENFRGIFDDVGALVTSASEDCSAILELLTATSERVVGLTEVGPELRQRLDATAYAVGGVLSMRAEELATV